MNIRIGKILAIPAFLIALDTIYESVLHTNLQSLNYLQLAIDIVFNLIYVLIAIGLWKSHYLARYTVIAYCIITLCSYALMFTQSEPVNVMGIENALNVLKPTFLIPLLTCLIVPYILALTLLFTKKAKNEFAKINVA